jgi:hypothetical protein
MKKIIAVVGIVLMMGIAKAQLVPDAIALTWNRTDASALFTTNNLLANASYGISNIVNNASGTRQDLTGCGAYFTVGTLATNIRYNATITDTNGILSATILFPSKFTASEVAFISNIQLTLTNGSVTVIYTGLKQVNIVNKL